MRICFRIRLVVEEKILKRLKRKGLKEVLEIELRVYDYCFSVEYER